MELFSSNIKKFLIFSQKKAFLIFPEMELPHISRSGNHEKVPDISENKNPKKFSYISGENMQNLKIKNFLFFFSNISAKEKNFL